MSVLASPAACEGVPVCTAIDQQLDHSAVPDAEGGFVVAWRDTRSEVPFDADVYAQRVGADGTVHWETDGRVIASRAGNPQVVADGNGGAIVAWQDGRNGGSDIYAQRLLPEDPAAVEPGAVPSQSLQVRTVPNPALGSVHIEFALERPETLDISVVDASGRRFRRLANDMFMPGQHSLSWDGRDATGERLPGGVCFILMESDAGTSSTRTVLLR